jgi:hypothetical protein
VYVCLTSEDECSFNNTAIKKVNKIMTSNRNKVNDATWSLSKSVRESNQAIADSFVSAQERNMKFAQSIFENEVELLKSHAEHTRSIMEEFVGEPEKSQAFFQTLANGAVTERNVKFAQSFLENGTELLKSQGESTRTLMQTLAQQSQIQQEAFQTLARETWDAYMGFFSSPLSYYQQTLETAETIAWQGVETAQKITRQGMEAAQKATHVEKQTVHTATK